MKKTIIISLSLMLILLSSLVNAQTLIFSEDWEDYPVGFSFNFTPDWVWNRDTNPDVERVILNSNWDTDFSDGSKSLMLNDSSWIWTHNFTPISSGIVNIFVNFKTTDNPNTFSFRLQTNEGFSSPNEFMGHFGIGSGITNNLIYNYVYGGDLVIPFNPKDEDLSPAGYKFQPNETIQYYGDIFGTNISENSFWGRIQVNYDTDEVDMFLYDKDKNYIAQHEPTYTNITLATFGRIGIKAGSGGYTFIDNVEVYTGEWIDVINESPTIPTEEVFDINLVDTLAFDDLVIHDVDVNEDASMLVFVGYNATSMDNYVGAVDLSSPISFSSNIEFRELDFEPYSVDISYDWVWISGYNQIEVIPSVLNPNYLSGISYNYNVTSYDTLFREIAVVPETDRIAYVCQFDLTGSFFGDGIAWLNLTTSNDLDYVEYFDETGCRGLDIANGHLFVDTGEDGIVIYEIESDYNLTLVSSFDSRTYFSTLGGYDGRSDMSNVYDDVLFTTDGGGSLGLAESIRVYDVSNEGSPGIISSVCALPNSNSDVASLEPIRDDLVIVVDDYDSNLYVCDMSVESSTASLLWDNPLVPSSFSEDYGRRLEVVSDGGNHYLYTHSIYNYLRIFEFTTINESVNQLPYFISGTPDSQYVDNLNPITTNVTPIGLETPIVNIYPLTCVSPLYDCSADFEDDTILFRVDKESDSIFDSAWTSFENVYVTYDTPGLKNLKIYITDSEHPNDYSVSKTIVVNVSGTAQTIPENYSTLKFRVRDSISEELLSGVEVRGSLEGDINTTLFGYTNAQGELSVITYQGVYLVSFELNDYVTSQNYFSTSSLVYNVYIEPVSPADKRSLTLYFKTINGTAIPYVFTELFMPITNSFDFKVSDAGGVITFSGFAEDNVIVSAEKTGYGSIEFDISVPLGSHIIRDVILGGEQQVVSGSGLCQDFIPGVLLCGMERISCSVDDDCSTGRCDDAGHCSNFNWTLCDESGMDRGNRCFVKYTGRGTLEGGTNWILDNFLYVLMIILVASFIAVIVWNQRR